MFWKLYMGEVGGEEMDNSVKVMKEIWLNVGMIEVMGKLCRWKIVGEKRNGVWCDWRKGRVSVVGKEEDWRECDFWMGWDER